MDPRADVQGGTKLRRFLLDGTMERYRNGTVKDRNGIGPKRTERQRTGSGTVQKSTEEYRSNTGLRPVMTGIGPVFSPVRYGSVTGLFFEKRSSTALFIQDRYWTSILYRSDTGLYRSLPVLYRSFLPVLDRYFSVLFRTVPLPVLYRSVPFRYRSIVPSSKNRRSLVQTLYLVIT